MDQTLFNFHDLALLLSSLGCFAFAIVILSKSEFKMSANTLFSLFLICHGLTSLSELILWGASFHLWALDASPNLFFSLNIAYYIDLPLLYFYFKTQYSQGFQFKKVHIVHGLPCLLFIIYIVSVFHSQTIDDKVALVTTSKLAYTSHYISIELLAKLLRLFYLAAIIVLLRTTRDRRITPWIMPVLYAFFVGLFSEVLLSLLKVIGLFDVQNLAILEAVGLSTYYASFLLIYTIIFFSLNELIKIKNKQPLQNLSKQEPINMEHVALIEKAMLEDQVYINPTLSLERLSKAIHITEKNISNIINRHYGVNFYEFINSYRIKEAQKILQQPEFSNKSITEIFYDAGFNSKSVYNTLFKKEFGETPSQYRKRFLKPNP